MLLATSRMINGKPILVLLDGRSNVQWRTWARYTASTSTLRLSYIMQHTRTISQLCPKAQIHIIDCIKFCHPASVSMKYKTITLLHKLVSEKYDWQKTEIACNKRMSWNPHTCTATRSILVYSCKYQCIDASSGTGHVIWQKHG